jgi:hypothetical protein
MLATLTRSYPELTKNEAEYSFVECATFADYIKTLEGSPFAW